MKTLQLFKMSANIKTLEQGFRNASKGRIVRRDLGSVVENIGDNFANSGRRMGPGTIGKSAPKHYNMDKRLAGKMFIEGDTGKHLGKRLKMDDPIKSVKNKNAEKRGLNASMNHHELDELKEFNKHGYKGRTAIAEGVGHHSYAKILGRESNRAVTASDTATKLGTKALSRIRNQTGESKIFNSLALKNSKGEKPFKYGRDRMNRSYLKAMYKKEKNMSIADLLKEIQ